METMNDFNRCGEELERYLLLQSSPLAVKMLEKESDIPKEAFRPKKDGHFHLAQCQAFAMSRREKDMVAMLKEDNWCPAPLMAYGLVPGTSGSHADYECLEYGKYVGILTAPLKTASFVPDMVLIYCDTNQLRRLLLAMKNEDKKFLSANFFPPSCAHSVAPTILKGQYRVVLPDPGEYGRALTQAGEMMFSVPKDKLGQLVADLTQYREDAPRFAHDVHMIMRPDFSQPEVYKQTFKEWGLDLEK
jgi:uncharacterized protein (DUF169 family)